MSRVQKVLLFILLSAVGIAFIYPLLWLVAASFKPNAEVFASIGLIPTDFVWDSYVKGWKGIGKNSYLVFFRNTFVLVLPVVVLTVLSSMLIAYGFARFQFPLKKLFFALMISTLMLPDAVIMIPRYLLFKNFGWLNTYLPFYIPALLGVNAFFIFLLIQFFRGIPRDLDEAAVMDGCGSFGILTKVLAPLCLPALVSVGLFQFLWTYNEFFNALIYINSVSKYPVSLGLRMTLDTDGAVSWNQVMAMSVVTLLPCVVVFFAAQKYFIEGITTTGIKG
ncbi:oligogalacturonide transport system permease protein [Paenibacillus sp. 1_12]|uniref:carbohydrate ABC transporter permease n=1 Tax=Paenibacillus sp. 1_12 TaxID=1566278 RepID=UPI0008F3087D|nr:carbohydrate ABC transporter permease [Paenibacillus sp. 1_12]SFM17127.1 oligogalacturonide transport system permease protein [Paenibacillus sp. 1_12]